MVRVLAGSVVVTFVVPVRTVDGGAVSVEKLVVRTTSERVEVGAMLVVVVLKTSGATTVIVGASGARR